MSFQKKNYLTFFLFIYVSAKFGYHLRRRRKGPVIVYVGEVDSGARRQRSRLYLLLPRVAILRILLLHVCFWCEGLGADGFLSDP